MSKTAFQYGLIPALFLSFSTSGVSQTQEAWVGSAAVDMTPPIGVPLGGYGGPKRRLPYDFWGRHRWATFLKPSIGVHDPIRSKAFLIQKNGRALLFISLDTIGVDYPLYMRIKTYAKTLGIDDVFVSATHTHSGPGTLSKSWVFQIMATDRFQPEVYRFILDSIKKSIELAMQDLKPSILFRTTFKAEDMQGNRRERPGHFDPEAHLLYAQDREGKIRGGLINFAVHPTSLGQGNLKFSADLAGGIENAMKSALKTDSEFLFMNGAEGDVSPRAHGFDSVETHSARFAESAKSALLTSKPVQPNWRTRSMNLTLPKGALPLWACDENILKKLFGKLRLGLGKRGLPRTAEIKQLVLDDVLMVTWPGEATTDVGTASKAQGSAAGFQETWNLGLTNGYNGYFVTEEEFRVGGYEVCVTYHGPKIAKILLDAHRKLLEGDTP